MTEGKPSLRARLSIISARRGVSLDPQVGALAEVVQVLLDHAPAYAVQKVEYILWRIEGPDGQG